MHHQYFGDRMKVAWGGDTRSVTSSVPEGKSAENGDVVRSTQQQQQGDVIGALKARDCVLHWCYSKYLQVRGTRLFACAKNLRFQ